MRRLIITALGTLMVLVGAAMIVLPGPGIIAILVGIWILSLEYDWAQRSLKRMRRMVQRDHHPNTEDDG